MGDGFATKVVHAGEGRGKPYDAVTMPIVQTSTYAFANTQAILDFVEDKEAGKFSLRGEYGRYGNPTQTAVEEKVASLEGGERGLLFSSGMSAITTVFLSVLSRGDHVVIASSIYRQTVHFVRDQLSRWGVGATFLKDGEVDSLEDSIRPNTKLIFCEAPTNPYLRVIDLDRVSLIARQHGVLTAIDSTFATPVNLRPLDHGIDLVIHSATKYLSGHNDLLAGVVIGSCPLLAPIETLRGVLGCVGSPHDAYGLLRGLKTLDLRIRQQNESGQQIAEFLEAHPRVRTVYYPGLKSHPDHAVAVRQMTGFGGVVSYEVAGDVDQTGRVIDLLRIPYIGPTLGGVETIAQQQALFISRDPVKRASYGISDSLIRYAAGIEDPRDLIADLDQALNSGAASKEAAA
ncbi:PLP-dependent transferase [Candidatus Bipolaricaulota bacterium]|nr:PLP-dependent transferase [Candidatus Bipolaricaulota bacterium]